LAETVEYASENVPYYRGRLDEHGIDPADIDGIDDIDSLPFTTSDAFADHYPDGLFATDRDALRRIHASSGTTGKPKIIGYTARDLDVWEEVMSRGLATAGVEPGDTVQNIAGYGLFTGGLGVHDAVEHLGATVVPTGTGNTRRQIELMVDLGTDAIHCIPSYGLYLAETAEELGYDPAELPVSTVVYGGEAATEPMRTALERRLGATALDNYGLSEIIGPGVAIECAEAQDGLHVWEDHFYPEIVDPTTGEPLPEGEEGELVLTTLTKEALPMLRYRTGDITSLLPGECPCGRPTRRIDNITGRSDDLLVVRGTNLYPGEIESVVLEFDETAPYYRIDLRREGTLDTVEITVEHTREFDGDADDLEARVAERLSSALALTPDDVSVVGPGTIDRSEAGKAKRVYDHRE
jgi:phenylacetate-CoA ligase